MSSLYGGCKDRGECAVMATDHQTLKTCVIVEASQILRVVLKNRKKDQTEGGVACRCVTTQINWVLLVQTLPTLLFPNKHPAPSENLLFCLGGETSTIRCFGIFLTQIENSFPNKGGRHFLPKYSKLMPKLKGPGAYQGNSW